MEDAHASDELKTNSADRDRGKPEEQAEKAVRTAAALEHVLHEHPQQRQHQRPRQLRLQPSVRDELVGVERLGVQVLLPARQHQLRNNTATLSSSGQSKEEARVMSRCQSSDTRQMCHKAKGH